MRNAIKLGLGVVAALAVLAQAARAQTCAGAGPCNVDNTASVSVPTILRLTISPTTTTTLGSPTETDYDAGFRDDPGPVATVKANRPWNLQISALAATWTGVGALARATKPAGDLQWNRGAGFTALTTTPASVYLSSQAAGGAQVTTFTYRVVWSWALDTPGDYTLAVRFTVTAP